MSENESLEVRPMRHVWEVSIQVPPGMVQNIMTAPHSVTAEHVFVGNGMVTFWNGGTLVEGFPISRIASIRLADGT